VDAAVDQTRERNALGRISFGVSVLRALVNSAYARMSIRTKRAERNPSFFSPMLDGGRHTH
jgi:hypothetical protein